MLQSPLFFAFIHLEKNCFCCIGEPKSSIFVVIYDWYAFPLSAYIPETSSLCIMPAFCPEPIIKSERNKQAEPILRLLNIVHFMFLSNFRITLFIVLLSP